MSSSNRKRRGNALLEFALGFPILWLLFSGMYQFGYSLYVYNRLMAAVSNAAELGSMINYDTGNPVAFTSSLQNMVLYSDEAAGTSPIVAGLTGNNVTVSVATDANSIPNNVTISITGYSINSFFNFITLNGKPRATMKYSGRVTCSTC